MNIVYKKKYLKYKSKYINLKNLLGGASYSPLLRYCKGDENKLYCPPNDQFKNQL